MNIELISTIIALVFAGIVFLICFFAFHLGGKSKNQRFIDKAIAVGHCAKGVIVDKKITSGDRDEKNHIIRYDHIWVTYEYVVSGNKYHVTNCYELHYTTHDYPLEVTVYYDGKKPSKAITSVNHSEKQYKINRYVLAIFLTILAYKLMKGAL